MQKQVMQLMTVREAASLLGVNPFTVKRWAKAKLLRGIKVGPRGDWRFTRESLEGLVKRGMKAGSLNGLSDKNTNEQRSVLETTFNKLPAGVGLYRGPEFIVEIANPTYLAIASGRNVLGKKYRDVWPEAYAQVSPLLKRVLKTGRAYEAVDEMFRLKNKTGAWENRYFTWSLVRIKLPGENNWGVLNTVIETTESKKNQDSLRQSQDTLQSFFNSAPFMMGIVEVVGKKSRIISGNRVVAEFFGQKQEKISGKSSVDMGTPPAIMEMWIKKYNESKRRGSPVKFEYEYPRPGAGRWFRSTVAYIATVNGNPRYSFVTEDVTDHKNIENIARENERQLQSIIDGTPGVVFVKDLEGRFITINKSLEKMLGTTREKIKGKTDYDLITRDLADVYRENDRKIALTGKPQQIIETADMKDGHHIFLAYKFPLHNREGKIYAICGISTDISQLKKLERQKDEFLSVASHELKTPITSLKAYTQILIKKIKQTDDLSNLKLLDSMEQQINRLTALISDLLDVTKIEAGKLMLPKAPFDLNLLVEEIINEISLAASRPLDIAIVGRIKGMVTADRFRIGQVITNLLTNAIKYSPDSNKILISLSQNKTEVAVSVKDFGLGIAKKDQEHVFERFYQAHPARSKEGRFSSLGLGLYIAAEIIRRHGGRIRVKSRKGKGSTFYFTLPMSS